MTIAHRAPGTDHGGLRGNLHGLLPHAADASADALLDAAHSADFVRRDRILTVDDAPRLVLVLAGHVGTWRSDAEGRSQLVALNGPGEFAALSALSTRAAPVDLVALDAGTAVSWDPATVRGVARSDAGLGADLLDLALRAGDRLATRLEHVTFDSVSRRLARLLWQRRELLFDPRRPLLSRPQLGELAGATREMTDRVIRDLEAQGIVERTGPTGLILREPHALHLLAGDDDERE